MLLKEQIPNLAYTNNRMLYSAEDEEDHTIPKHDDRVDYSNKDFLFSIVLHQIPMSAWKPFKHFASICHVKLHLQLLQYFTGVQAVRFPFALCRFFFKRFSLFVFGIIRLVER